MKQAKKKRRQQPTTVMSLKGMVRKPRAPISIDAMNLRASPKAEVIRNKIEQLRKSTVRAGTAIDVALTYVENSEKRIVEMERERLFGVLAGSVKEKGDIVAPLENEWEAFKENTK